MHEKVTPESVGIESSRVLEFVKTLDGCRLHTHSIIMSRGDGIFAESYYAPFCEDFLHRMYSVSKSFIAMAVGVAVREGLFSLDDSVVGFFPEFRNENTDAYHDECTVRDMLSMRSNVGSGVAWWGRFKSRVEAYYSLKTDKIPGTLYFYDSIGCFLLGCIIEKLTGMDFLEYLKDRVLIGIGFSKESYTLREPGGFTVGDSGVMCTAKDLWLFARFIMKGGVWDGVRYVDEEFMRDAVSALSYNDTEGNYSNYGNGGYGYLIWKTHPDGFSLVGMGDQLAVCDMKRDVTFVITSDNQGERGARHVIYHEFYRHFLEYFKDGALPSDTSAYTRLCEYLARAELVCQRGCDGGALCDRVSGVRYLAEGNSVGLRGFTLTLDGEVGELKLDMECGGVSLEFGIEKNKLTEFSFGQRARYDMMGIYEEGKYRTAASGAWVDKGHFVIRAQVIDTYFGCLSVHISYKDDRATVQFARYGQYVFEGMDGYAVCHRAED